MRTQERKYDLVVMAASAGGLPALRTVLSALPKDFPVPVALVQHRAAAAPEVLPSILRKATPLHVKNAEAGERLQAGTIYVAPPDRHLMVLPDFTLALVDGSKIKFTRSSANPLFESAAQAVNGRLVAVVLTGGGANGTDGVQIVQALGGHVIAQDQASSLHFGMPRAAIATGCVHSVLPLEAIGPTLVHLVMPTKETTAGQPAHERTL
jgi:two-component system chemotaxis response regulator CheB